ncbi:FKBP-type peptidyl-prolyl cis-trans isomerase [Desulfurivibrio alkaliphilus]|uniref:Peptidyl-prolyl cis-trans isomerase n=1 Tax=Desulfurivibrio alkaliphilus (strain DSM 19089 / UNIQEM U267 / AHT2) TaxID=589865 RepID=D6Z3C9_DESAT|nr:peptidylprolyl isomerase [Desulfurivibrio alkaliphilus]ADH86054.1 peptidylprolyl isomerase FKBP-type [Desulfurivibrio alkaliphilus AHT 2]
MRKAQENDQVTIQYEGRLASGEVFESSSNTAPMTFRIGEQMILPSLERAILGMTAGQTRTISIPPDEGYGPHLDELEITVRRASFGDQEIKPGMVLAMNMERDGQTHRLPALVKEIEGEQVRVDFNHPLAGEELFYTITVQEVTPAEEKEQ